MMEKVCFDELRLSGWIEQVEHAFKHSDENSFSVHEAYKGIIDGLDRGKISAIEFDDRERLLHPWVQKAILLLFQHEKSFELGWEGTTLQDKLPLKSMTNRTRLVPMSAVRYGSYLGEGSVVMSAFINVGARIGAYSRIEPWASVGSCAQLGERVHLMAGSRLSGALDLSVKHPVVIEDDVVVGSLSLIGTGISIGEGAVIGSRVTLSNQSPILDLRGGEAKLVQGEIPAGAVVIAGTTEQNFPAGTVHVPAACIVGERIEAETAKESLQKTVERYRVTL